jgi:hypothetical protein
LRPRTSLEDWQLLRGCRWTNIRTSSRTCCRSRRTRSRRRRRSSSCPDRNKI